MEYYKQEGSYWTTFYALNLTKSTLLVLELRYSNPSNHVLDTIYSSAYTSPEEFTEQNVTAIRRYEHIQKKDFIKAQKEAAEWIKKQGE
jgi:hypothetical protein